MSARDAVHPLKRRKNRRSEKVSLWQDFGYYQMCLLVATQLSYMPITSSMLAPNFMKMSKAACDVVIAARNGTNSTGTNNTTGPSHYSGTVPEGEFHSLLTLWNLDCTKEGNDVQTFISTAVMFGAFMGAVICGFVADRWGRKPVVIASLVLASFSNALLLLSTYFHWAVTLPIFFVLGLACGGYMLTNLVLLVESLTLASSRLLVVALNGWSLSMAGMALLGFLCPHWFQYHLSISIISLISAAVLFFISDESLRWLKSSHKTMRFEQASARLAKFNGEDSLRDVTLLCQLERDGDAPAQREIAISSNESGEAPAPALSAHSMSYMDLFAEKSLRPRLFSLAYCFFASSIASFGFYFSLDSLSGNRFANQTISGIGKFLLGLLPFIVSSCVGRKQIALISVAAATAAAWSALACLLYGASMQSVQVMVLALFATAALDPTWKISHLYSTELFPTNMRNMARGVCQSAGRVGSMVAPLVAHLRHDQPHLSFGLFAALLTGQFVITLIFLPAQPPNELQDTLPVAAPPEKKRKQKTSEYGEEDDDVRSRENSSQLSESAPLTP